MNLYENDQECVWLLENVLFVCDLLKLSSKSYFQLPFHAFCIFVYSKDIYCTQTMIIDDAVSNPYDAGVYTV